MGESQDVGATCSSSFNLFSLHFFVVIKCMGHNSNKSSSHFFLDPLSFGLNSS